ncbi:WGR domain-containing protein [Tenacibaculum finnmarkense genomovar ulcerans]|uniref:WGR domain-containing protein n=1 Tax=Tenacibaculum finnmarkense TaxID=2781243 RepID=UPI001E2F0391|nr:WGR domain-containing protein [Tenacibaculum finnmarkense]MCD8432127.1 WGR domain-containing protein [Tenacibaculum finnmarkense genomovar ulcerans]
MKLIKQKKLYFSDEKSDKVYEVDLCESQDLFIVNFRYGRRGASLREGTKTVFPVSYEEAEKIFNKLVGSKEKKGYAEANLSEKKQVENPKKEEKSTTRKDTILKYLNQALKGTYTRNWKVSRIINRVGVLKIREAIPLIAQFIHSSDKFEQYNALSVLIDFNESNYVEDAIKIFKKDTFNTIGARISVAYILKYGNATNIKIVQNEVAKHITKSEIDSLATQFLGEGSKNSMLLFYAYIHSYNNDVERATLFDIIAKIPLKVNTFKSVRYIYRAAYAINDIQFFALVSKRIAISNATYSSDYPNIDDEYNWVEASVEKKKPNPRIAFSGKTKNYFNKNTYQKIYTLSTENQQGYIACAKEILCSLNDQIDVAPENTVSEWVYNQETGYELEKRQYPKYHQFLALMYILYGNSTRFKCIGNKWFYIDELTDNTIREDILPTVWNEKPSEVLYILANAKSSIAVDFSLKIIKENPHFLENLSEEILAKLIRHYHPKVLDLIAEVLEQKYATTQASEDILLILVSSKNKKAVELGIKWLGKYEASYLSSTSLVTKLLLTDEVLVIDYLSNLYQNRVAYNTPIFIDDLITLFDESSNYTADFLISVNNLIGNTFFGKLLSATSAQYIVSLSASSSVTNQLFAINLAKHNTTSVYELFKDTYKEYITSDEAVLRTAGIELLAYFPDEFLLENKQDIIRFCFSEHEAVRKAIQPTIRKLIHLDEEFKEYLRKKLLASLTEDETYEGLHQNCFNILIQFYGTQKEVVSEEEIIALILSKHEFAQKLGTPLFERRVDMNNLKMSELVRLAHSDVFSVRTQLHDYFKNNVARVNYELEEALPIFNTNWQDVIDWADAYFRTHIKPKNWTVALLLYVCDHIKDQVQHLGRSLITTHFSEEKGLPLLVSLQEHPTKSMQFFVTNYLEGYASDNIKVILQLEDYFKTTLFYINTNRATKTRVYSFLENQSKKYKEIAVMTVRVLTAILDTKTAIDKDKIIDILITISEIHTDVEVPLLIK